MKSTDTVISTRLVNHKFDSAIEHDSIALAIQEAMQNVHDKPGTVYSIESKSGTVLEVIKK